MEGKTWPLNKVGPEIGSETGGEDDWNVNSGEENPGKGLAESYLMVSEQQSQRQVQHQNALAGRVERRSARLQGWTEASHPGELTIHPCSW